MTRLRQRSITIWVPDHLHTEFKRICAVGCVDMTTVLKTYILDCIKKAQEIEKEHVEQF